MARIADDLIQQLKQDISIVRLAEGYGIQLKKHGKDYLGCCPFHDDKTPSFVISPQNNLWNCLGACNEGGSVIDFVMKQEKLSFRHAVEKLKSDHLVLSNRDEKTETSETPPSLAADSDDQVLLQRVIEFYHATLKQSAEALAYLDSRGLNDPELINYFKLGFSNRTLGYRLPEKSRKAGAEIREQLQRIGLYRDSGHEHFNGSLVIPVINEQGSITEVYGRKLLNNLRKGTPKHLYLPGPHEGIFNPECLASKEIILCESLIDALTFWRWGFKNVTTSYGIGGFTDELLEAFKSHQTQRVLIAYDRDDAGNQAAEKVAKVLMAEGIECYRVHFPKGMDANEYALQGRRSAERGQESGAAALKMTPARTSLELVVRKAEFMGKGQDPRQAEEVEPAPSLAAPAHPAPAALEHPCSSAAKKQSEAPLPATPKPPLPLEGVDVEQSEEGLFVRLGSREYRVRGLENNKGHEQLKVQVMAQQDEAMHMDKLDLYSSKQRQVFINQASVELGLKDEVIKKDLLKVLLVLEEKQNEARQSDVQPEITLSEADQQAALDLLNDPNLIERILADFKLAGVIGEETNKLVGYLACVSRKMDKPLAVMIQSSSAAGKSSLMDSVLNLMPEEERIQYSAMTGQSLFYMGQTNLKHKILAIAEEEGASNASYALKLLQSEGEVTIASTSKDESTGDLVTKEYKVEGPVMLFFTTTAIDNDEELVNRCLVLSVNEDCEQTAGIHDAQRDRRTAEGKLQALQKKQILNLHQNAQRLLKPITVVNPYARDLTFPTHKVRLRRDNEKYLNLIDSIALLHQTQRKKKVFQCGGDPIEYIEVTLEDIELANRLAAEVLGKTLDELPQQTRKLLTLVQSWVKCQCQAQGLDQSDFRFSRRHVRELCGWSVTQVRVHLQRLVEMEYLLVHGGRRGQSFEYELMYSGQGEHGDAFLNGLIDIDTLKAKVNARKKAPVITMTRS